MIVAEFIIAHYHEGKKETKKKNKILKQKDVHFTQINPHHGLLNVVVSDACDELCVREVRAQLRASPARRKVTSVVDVVPVHLYQPLDRVDEAGYCADASDNENGNVKEDVVPQEVPPLEFEVEERRQ